MLRITKDIIKYLKECPDYDALTARILTEAAATIQKQQGEISTLKQLLIKNRFGTSTQYDDPAQMIKRYTNPILPDKLG